MQKNILSISHPGSVKPHQLTHNGKKKYSCDICEKSYTQLNDLKDHILTHTAENNMPAIYVEKHLEGQTT